MKEVNLNRVRYLSANSTITESRGINMVGGRHRVTTKILGVAYSLCWSSTINIHPVHRESSNCWHIFELVIDENGAAWVNPSLLDHMLTLA